MSLLHTSPGVSAVDKADGRDGHTELPCNRTRSNKSAKCPDLANLFLTQLGARMPASLARPTLQRSVVCVVCDRPEEQVVWIHASAVVAGMENMEAVRGALIDDNPRHAVSRHSPVWSVSSRNAVLAIPVAGTRCRPIPATVSTPRLRPEALNELGILGRAQDKLVGTHAGLLGAFVLGAGRSGHAALGPVILPQARALRTALGAQENKETRP